ncbi:MULTISPECIES: hypothetical protein [unclassified Oceanobacter]|uniref:hypothetical protein n=1 Tax=unclassified Oceanobacter TaxID=2620260 RepID=UPI00273559C6|nr:MULTISPECIES: hypothetical protein [unclassified Oceanobacter]MDP2610038.1 hypothetical protein [Oceanobacter sp. 1_MG-2023]MDP2613326.1 hypothetical protein [Oceanobacter sp. 2_MG-2023]
MFDWFGAAKSIEAVATEWIETDTEKAEARAVMVKALDPNGKMRRDIARTVSRLFQLYVVLMVVLVIAQALDVSTTVMVDGVEVRSVDIAVESLADLFMPIVGLFGTITTASFGVNAVNSFKGN